MPILTVAALAFLLSGEVVGIQVAPQGRDRPKRVSASQGPLGALLDLYTRRPYASVLVRLTDRNNCAADTTTDADGRFRFPHLPRCASPSLELVVIPCSDCFAVVPLTTEHNPVAVSRGDLGTLLAPDDRGATATFSEVCEGAAPPSSITLATPIVILSYEKADAGPRLELGLKGTPGWTVERAPFSAHNELGHGGLLVKRIASWPAVLCVQITETEVGRYRAPAHVTDNRQLTAYRTNASVTLVRMTDGRRFHDWIQVEPPASTSFGRYDYLGMAGDARPGVLEWLKKVAAENP